jgi:hypothetical protein
MTKLGNLDDHVDSVGSRSSLSVLNNAPVLFHNSSSSITRVNDDASAGSTRVETEGAFPALVLVGGAGHGGIAGLILL